MEATKLDIGTHTHLFCQKDVYARGLVIFSNGHKCGGFSTKKTLYVYSPRAYRVPWLIGSIAELVAEHGGGEQDKGGEPKVEVIKKKTPDYRLTPWSFHRGKEPQIAEALLHEIGRRRSSDTAELWDIVTLGSGLRAQAYPKLSELLEQLRIYAPKRHKAYDQVHCPFLDLDLDLDDDD